MPYVQVFPDQPEFNMTIKDDATTQRRICVVGKGKRTERCKRGSYCDRKGNKAQRIEADEIITELLNKLNFQGLLPSEQEKKCNRLAELVCCDKHRDEQVAVGWAMLEDLRKSYNLGPLAAEDRPDVAAQDGSPSPAMADNSGLAAQSDNPRATGSVANNKCKSLPEDIVTSKRQARGNGKQPTRYRSEEPRLAEDPPSSFEDARHNQRPLKRSQQDAVSAQLRLDVERHVPFGEGQHAGHFQMPETFGSIHTPDTSVTIGPDAASDQFLYKRKLDAVEMSVQTLSRRVDGLMEQNEVLVSKISLLEMRPNRLVAALQASAADERSAERGTRT
ncbi:hypothetical protein BAUCODRAFT_36709 [Baudoinia panamericana UAMH 10762]|uniref:Uncharacterized protein n=1 Tax=Baudoinia panamericana (strain UAMH 10762) TaxID=717646 RepID=M2MCI9_BAUPA|nr:uncharacterized protein BAUCODRAFT_36709 [Baudoinia panamericana UAMH 10762]EMC94241.1 hypothetical protein BAUCODRAFT_36709 [Baudoinia panamericana UAMH 10762]